MAGGDEKGMNEIWKSLFICLNHQHHSKSIVDNQLPGWGFKLRTWGFGVENLNKYSRTQFLQSFCHNHSA